MPFHITAVSQLPLSVHWRGGHRADWQGGAVPAGTHPQGRPEPDPTAPGRRCPGTPSTFLQTLAVPLPPQPILDPAVCPVRGLFSGQVPAARRTPCHVPNSPEAPHVPSPGCQATPNPSRVAREWVPLGGCHGRGALGLRPQAGVTKARPHSLSCPTRLWDHWPLHGSGKHDENILFIFLFAKSRTWAFRWAAQPSITHFTVVTVQPTGRRVLFYFHERHMLVEFAFL